MQNFTYENQGSNTFLVYKVEPEDAIDSMSLGMITNNSIDGLAKAVFCQIDETKYIKYNVSVKVPVSQIFSSQVNKKRFVGVFSGIVNALIAAEEYMLEMNSIILDFDYIFSDVTTCETVLICLPITNEIEQVELGSFFKNIVFGTQFDQTENCDYVAKIINYLNSTPVFSLNDFKSVLDEIKNENLKYTSSNLVSNYSTPIPPETASPMIAQASTIVGSMQNQTTVLPPENTLNTPLQQQNFQQTIKSVEFPIKPQATNNTSFKIPGQQPQISEQKKQPQMQSTTSVNNEKPMSWFYLMQHYNKENAELYKSQKEAKKSGTVTPASTSSSASSKKDKKKKKNASSSAAPVQNGGFGYAIPGQNQPMPATAPVNKTPVMPAPGGMNVPSVSVQHPPVQPQVPVQPKVSVPTGGPAPVSPIQTPPVFTPRPQNAGQTMNFGETTVLNAGAIGETTVLTAQQNPNQMVAPHLIRKKNNEKISLNKPVFRVGKERSYVDYFIGDNTTISRSHANFITRDNEYFVVDTNSTNHTFVNDVMIQSNVETKIAHGDRIRLANEDFEFKLF